MVCTVYLAKWPQWQHKQQLASTCILTHIRWLQAWHKLEPVLAWIVTLNEVATNPIQEAGGLSSHYGTHQRVPSPALVAASLVYSTASPMPASPAQVAINCRSLCSSHQAAQGQAQAVNDLGLHHSPSQEAPELRDLVTSFTITPEHHLTTYTNDTSERQTQLAPEPH